MPLDASIFDQGSAYLPSGSTERLRRSLRSLVELCPYRAAFTV